MKWLIWSIAALVVLCWTLFVSIVAGLASWLAMHGGKVLPELGQGVELMWPSWLTELIPAVWLDPVRDHVEMMWK